MSYIAEPTKGIGIFIIICSLTLIIISYLLFRIEVNKKFKEYKEAFKNGYKRKP
jgi:hypothetical protein